MVADVSLTTEQVYQLLEEAKDKEFDIPLSAKDVLTALQFLYSSDETDFVVIVCKKKSYIPYVRRVITQVLGMPSKAVTSTEFWYRRGTKGVILGSVDSLDKIRHLSESVFYVAEKTRDDWNTMCQQAEVRFNPVPYLTVEGLVSEIDVVNWLIRDGVNADSAVYMVSNQVRVPWLEDTLGG